jgi:hypothetical protein
MAALLNSAEAVAHLRGTLPGRFPAAPNEAYHRNRASNVSSPARIASSSSLSRIYSPTAPARPLDEDSTCPRDIRDFL